MNPVTILELGARPVAILLVSLLACGLTMLLAWLGVVKPLRLLKKRKPWAAWTVLVALGLVGLTYVIGVFRAYPDLQCNQLGCAGPFAPVWVYFSVGAVVAGWLMLVVFVNDDNDAAYEGRKKQEIGL